MDKVSWLDLAVQASGAIVVCGMFLNYLSKQNDRSAATQAEFLRYLQSRDSQSKEIAASGHEALREHARSTAAQMADLKASIEALREDITGRTA